MLKIKSWRFPDKLTELAQNMKVNVEKNDLIGSFLCLYYNHLYKPTLFALNSYFILIIFCINSPYGVVNSFVRSTGFWRYLNTF